MYCIKCGHELIEKKCDFDGMIPYCPNCQEFCFPMFNSAISAIVLNPTRDKILLIQQYGSQENILIAGYINKGENAKEALSREIKEETDLDIVSFEYNDNEYYKKTNTLIHNYTVVVDSEVFHTNHEIDYAKWYPLAEALEKIKPHSLAKSFLERYFHRKHLLENTPLIQTERLILRRFTCDDMEAILNIYSDQEVNTYLPWYPIYSLEQARNLYHKTYENIYQQDRGYHYAICLLTDNIPIGYVHLNMDESHDLGYGLCQEFWHQGIVSEAVRALIEKLKEDRLGYITATHDIHNVRSGEVMKRLGMTYQYTYEEQWMPKNKLVTFRMYQLNFDEHQKTYLKYWKESENHYIETI